MPPKEKRQYCKYNKQTMQLTLAEIDKSLSINKAAKKFGIPKHTLSDRKN